MEALSPSPSVHDVVDAALAAPVPRGGSWPRAAGPAPRPPRYVTCMCKQTDVVSTVEVALCAMHRDALRFIDGEFESRGWFAIAPSDWDFIENLEPCAIRLFGGGPGRCGAYVERVVVAVLTLRKSRMPRGVSWKALLRDVVKNPALRAAVETMCDEAGYPGTEEFALPAVPHPLAVWAGARYPVGKKEGARP